MSATTQGNYYNEHDPKAAAWLRELINRRLIPAGTVDERSIEDVRPDDLMGYRQCHFFAGIGGWSRALKLADWPDDRPVWTGSCPCQPFSQAGKGGGVDDERHLWPAFRWLIDQCRPSAIYGEQVASAAGRLWLAGVRTDLEAMGYAVGAADLCAAGIGAPHIRQRLFWMAGAGHEREGRGAASGQAEGGRAFGDAAGCGARIGLADSSERGLGICRGASGECGLDDVGSEGGGLGDAVIEGLEGHAGDGDGTAGRSESCGSTAEAGSHSRLANPESGGCGGRSDEPGRGEDQRAAAGRGGEGGNGGVGDADGTGLPTQRGFKCGNVQGSKQPADSGSHSKFWSRAVWIECGDGKARRIKSGIAPLAHGVSATMVVVCAECKTETKIDENMHYLRRFAVPDEGRDEKEVLLFGMLRTINDLSSSGGRPRPGQEATRPDSLQSLPHNGNPAGSPQRQKLQKQCAGQPRNTLSPLPRTGTFTSEEAVIVRCMWGLIRGKGPSGAREDMHCSVCERVGPHQCNEEMGGGRVVELRGYGNAIVPQVAAEFIRAAVEAQS